MTDVGAHHLNPWIGIWIRPRKVMRSVLDTQPEHMVIPIAALLGVGGRLDTAVVQDLGDTHSILYIFAGAAFGGAIGGVLFIYILGAIIGWTGKWIGGRARNTADIRAAMAWGSVPIVWSLLLWVPELALFGEEWFKSATPRMDANPNLVLAFGVVEMTTYVWGIVVWLKCLAEAQGFSAWRALGNTILAVMVFGAAVIALVIVVTNLIGLLR